MPRVIKNVALTEATKKKLKVYAVENEVSMNQLIVEMLHRYGQGKARKPATPPSVVKDKVSIQPDIWESASLRAQLEGKTVLEILEEEAKHVLRG